MLVFGLLAVTASVASGQTFTSYLDRHDFGGTVKNANGTVGPDGQAPYGGVCFDAAGNMYGTASHGGPNYATDLYTSGILWEITSTGEYIDLHDFGGPIATANGQKGSDGSFPHGIIAFDSQGNMYGSTVGGGANGAGMVWELTKAGAYKDLHDFGGSYVISGTSYPDGSTPYSDVTIDSSGNLYGTTWEGAENGVGLIWKITTSHSYEVLHVFGGTITNADGSVGPDGGGAFSGVLFGPSGTMYGATAGGGPNGVTHGGSGILWRLTPGGAYTDLHDFGGAIGGVPDGDLPGGTIIDSQGDIFGTSATGGTNKSSGNVWEYTSGGAYKTLHEFGSGTDGAQPESPVTIDSAGNLYGTTYAGGTLSGGMVWEIPKSGPYRDLHDFYGAITDSTGQTSMDGYQPYAGVTLDRTGNLFGVTYAGGGNIVNLGGEQLPTGMLWELEIASPLKSVSFEPSAVVGTTTSTGTVHLGTPAPSSGYLILLSSSTSAATVPSSVTVPSGATTASFVLKTTPVAANAVATISAKLGIVSKTGTITVKAASLSAFTVTNSTVVGGGGLGGKVTLTGPPPSAGATVQLTSSNPSVVSVPSSVLVHSGNESVNFSIKTSAVKSTTQVTVKAFFGSVTKSVTVTVNP